MVIKNHLRQQLTTGALATALAVGLAIVLAGGFGGTAHASPAAQGAGPFDVCALLLRGEVEQVLRSSDISTEPTHIAGLASPAPGVPEVLGGDYCTWYTNDSDADLTLGVVDHRDPAALASWVEDWHRAYAQGGLPLEIVSGLGDGAFSFEVLGERILQIVRGRYLISVSRVPPDVARDVAAKALGRMP